MRLLSAVFLVLTFLASGCVGGPEEITVGAVYPTGGNQGPGGLDEWRGVQLAAEAVNERGGVDGRPVRLQLERTDTSDAVPAAVDQLADTGASVIVGSYGSTLSRVGGRVASERGLVFWETGAVGAMTQGAEASGLVFRVPPSGEVLGREAVRFVRERLDVDHPTFAVTYVDDVYGRAVASGAIEELSDEGLVTEIPYEVDDLDAAAIVEGAEEAGADALFVVAYLDDGVAIREAMVRAGSDLITIGTSSSYCMPAFGKILGGAALGVFASDKPDGATLDPDRLEPEAAELLRWARATYEQRHGEPMSAPALAGFSGAWGLFGHVLPRASALTPEGIATAAREIDVPRGGLPNGSGLAFDRHVNTRATSVIWQWVDDGDGVTRQIVWPPPYATHPIVAPAA